MKIGYVTNTNPKDRLSQSGAHYSMFNALKTDGTDVVHIGRSLWSLGSRLPRPLKRARRFLRAQSARETNYEEGMRIAQLLQKEIVKANVDLLYTANSPTSCLETDLPIVYRSDLTYRLYCEHYPIVRRAPKAVRDYQEEAEARKIQRADLIIYPSQWAADSAVEDYGASREKILVAPSGANVENIPSMEEILANRAENPCRLLFLGREWERKGGAIAVETTIALNEMGLKTELIIVGTQPDFEVPSEFVTVVGFLDKNSNRERAQLEQLLKSCHFMHVPTRGEAFSLAFCEASAFGLPVISTATGGVPSAVKNGINGQLLPLEARGSDYAKVIIDLFSDRKAYEKLMVNSRKLYDDSLNWGAWGDVVRPRVMDLLRSR
ncbi:MAG: hypothetical protein CL917_17280 [Deltaproteobacteria bacterium]|nr:hypothetical protein [Deltaproteobacteria bacterium]